MQEILMITQQIGAQLRVLAGQIEDTACKYVETLELPSTVLEKLIKSWFKHTIVDLETKSQILWDDTDMTLDQMIQKA